MKQVNGDGLSISNQLDLETFKADILREIRLEINKAKQEIIDGEYCQYPKLIINILFQFFISIFSIAIKAEFNRR